MRWVSLGSIGLIAFMGCTGPVAAQQTQSRPKQKRGATRALLLASTALATGIFAGAMVNPQTAQASCSVPLRPPGLNTTDQPTYQWFLVPRGFRDFFETPTVTCGPTNTSNGEVLPPVVFSGIPLSGVILPEATVSGLGLRFESNREGNPLSVTNAGTVTIAQASTALELVGHGGDVSYTGNGSVMNTGSGGALSIINTGMGNVI